LPYYKTGPELINKLSSPGYEDLIRLWTDGVLSISNIQLVFFH
jgi:hypothetical protein